MRPTKLLIFVHLLVALSLSGADLAVKDKLLFDDDGSVPRGGKKPSQINEAAKVRAWAGKWEKRDGAWRSTWEKGMGHTPVMAYDVSARDLVVEVTFRYGPLLREGQHQCFRITLDNRDLYTGHVLSAWANPNNDFIETGFLLQHIHKRTDKSIVSDILLDRQELKIEPGIWVTAWLEVVGDEALFQMGDHVAYARHKKLDVEKLKVALTLGTTWHEVKRVRVWSAKRNPDWGASRSEALSRRKSFKPKPHNHHRSKK